jgi:hypothetical protein
MLADPNTPTLRARGPNELTEPLVPADPATPARTSHLGTRWFRRLGLAGFLFFLIKGLMWLMLPGLIALWRHLER